MSLHEDSRPHVLVIGGDLGIVGGVMLLLDGTVDIHAVRLVAQAFYCVHAHKPEVVCYVGCITDPIVCLLHTVRQMNPVVRVMVAVSADQEMMLRELATLPLDSLLTLPVSALVLGQHIAALSEAPIRAELARWHGNRYVSATVSYLSAHYDEPMIIDQIASMVGASASHLARVFRAVTGATLHDWLMRLRIAVTKTLLLETDDKLEVIAERVGFCDASHLSRVFSRSTGENPGQFRRSCRQDPHMASPSLDRSRHDSLDHRSSGQTAGRRLGTDRHRGTVATFRGAAAWLKPVDGPRLRNVS